jgi:single-strand DNA-binding protein
MAGFNKVILLGNLTRDPELKYLPNNTAVCELGLAVSRNWRDKDGNMQEEVCFVDLNSYGRQAEVLKQYLVKGRPLMVEGRLKLDQWTAQDGTKRSKMRVVVENFQFVGGRPDGAGGGGPQGAPAGARSGGGQSGGQRPANEPPPREEDYSQPAPDDIPF